MLQYTNVDGKTEGTFRSWYDDGQPKREWMLEAGRFEGPHREWYKNGNDEVIGGYVAGKMDGIWTWSLEDGRLLTKRTYADGKLLEELTYT